MGENLAESSPLGTVGGH